MSGCEIPRIARVVGTGVAAASAAATLARFGWLVEMSVSARRNGFAIALNGPSRYLLDRIWGPGLLAGLPHHRLAYRVILWRDRVFRRIDDDVTVVDTSAIAERMTSHAAVAGVRIAENPAVNRVAWTIVATGRRADAAMMSGGNRVALAAPVVLAASADARALVIEAGTRGWIALVPAGNGRGTVFACLPATPADAADALDGMVTETTAIRPSVAMVTGPPVVLDAAPRLQRGHGDTAAVFAGDAALAFDPVSGDGVGAALRTAHLGASLAEAYARGVSLRELHAFHAYRLDRAMSVHLQGLLTLYADAPFAARWTQEREAMRNLAASLASRLGTPRGRLFAISQAGLNPIPDPVADGSVPH